MSILLAIIGLGLLITVHELGHMSIARLVGMRVEKFSLGFGPVLWQHRGRQTIFQLAAIPLGGFVQIAGMNPHEELPANDSGSYQNKPAWARFATILAGPLTNYLCAIIFIVLVMLGWGLPSWRPTVAEVVPQSAAAQGGLMHGDMIVEIEHQPIRSELEVQEKILGSKGQPLRFLVNDLSGKERQVTITPRAEGNIWRIGIHFGRKLHFSPLRPWQAVALGAIYPFQESGKALAGLGQLFSGKASLKQVGGPLEIVRQLKMSFEDSMVMAIVFLAMLNVYLGLFNLLPVPALDGGRLIFLLFTMITRRPINQRMETTVHTIGFVILFALLLLVTYRDLLRLLGFNN